MKTMHRAFDAICQGFLRAPYSIPMRKRNTRYLGVIGSTLRAGFAARDNSHGSTRGQEALARSALGRSGDRPTQKRNQPQQDPVEQEPLEQELVEHPPLGSSRLERIWKPM